MAIVYGCHWAVTLRLEVEVAAGTGWPFVREPRGYTETHPGDAVSLGAPGSAGWRRVQKKGWPTPPAQASGSTCRPAIKSHVPLVPLEGILRICASLCDSFLSNLLLLGNRWPTIIPFALLLKQRQHVLHKSCTNCPPTNCRKLQMQILPFFLPTGKRISDSTVKGIGTSGSPWEERVNECNCLDGTEPRTQRWR